MASDGSPVKLPVASPIHGSQAHIPPAVQERGGKFVPPGGKPAAAPAAQAANKTNTAPSADELVAQLNKHLNHTGRPDQFRVDPNSGNKVIQQINPETGDVVGEFLISEFPALARSVGISGGVLVDSRA